jgi:hypothetical protein
MHFVSFKLLTGLEFFLHPLVCAQLLAHHHKVIVLLQVLLFLGTPSSPEPAPATQYNQRILSDNPTCPSRRTAIIASIVTDEAGKAGGVCDRDESERWRRWVSTVLVRSPSPTEWRSCPAPRLGSQQAMRASVSRLVRISHWHPSRSSPGLRASWSALR